MIYTPMADYRYIIKPRASRKIFSFYQNAVFSIFRIENGLLRREPTISQWAGYHMANTDKWYFAYTIDGDTITVVDARHAQNMRD